MDTKHAILFGATGGIGQNLLELLLLEGYDVLLPVRNISLAELNLQKYILDSQNSVKFTQIDLGDSQSIKDFILRFQERQPSLLIFASGIRGANFLDNQNLDFEINYVAPLTIAIDFLTKFPSLSVINVTSSAAFRVKITSSSALFHKKNSSFGGNYAKSKLALVLASSCLSKLYPESRIISVDPGSNRTKMTLGHKAPLILRIAAMLFFSDPHVGADRVMNAIFSKDITSGAHITAKGKTRDMERYKSLLSFINLQIEKGFPYMPL
jgi:NAD(P)-dependent dehydrogenase (short-subunit alcohol dehydrogenase family)